MTINIGSIVRVAYDFVGEAENEELSVQEGDKLTVRFTDVGDGWLQCEDSQGNSGLVPEAYVEVIDAKFSNDDWANAFGGTTTAPPVANNDPFGDSFGIFGQSSQGRSVDTPSRTTEPTFGDGHDNTIYNAENSFPDTALATTGQKKGGIFGGKGKINDPFFMGPSPGSSGEDLPSIESINSVVKWVDTSQRFVITVGNPEKSSKLGGIKTFIQYQITPTNTNRAVLRRYKHFDWLHEQLTRKYSSVCIIPPLPGKQVTGRYEDDFVSDRMIRLQSWGSRMCKHPLLSKAPVFQHFLTSSDDEKAWKGGKRSAEKDSVVADLFSLQIKTPEDGKVDPTKHQVWLHERTRHNKQMSESFDQFYNVSSTLANRLSVACRKDYEKLGQASAALAESTMFDTSPTNQKLLLGLRSFSTEMKVVGDSVHASDIWTPLSDGLLEYRGLLQAMPQLLNNNISVMNRLDELRKAQISQKITSDQLTEAKKRAETLSYVVQGEIQHFDDERVREMTDFMANFLRLQISAYGKAMASLNSALEVLTESFGPNIGLPTEELVQDLEKRRQNSHIN